MAVTQTKKGRGTIPRDTLRYQSEYGTSTTVTNPWPQGNWTGTSTTGIPLRHFEGRPTRLRASAPTIRGRSFSLRICHVAASTECTPKGCRKELPSALWQFLRQPEWVRRTCWELKLELNRNRLWSGSKCLSYSPLCDEVITSCVWCFHWIAMSVLA